MSLAPDGPGDDGASDDVLEAHVDAAAALHGLAIAADWRPGVVAHFKAIHAAAVLVLGYPLDEDVEAAPVFTP